MNNIAIILTSFLRDALLYKSLQNIVDFAPKNCIIFVGDQGYASKEKEITIDYFKSQINLEYYQLPFDSGLSYARNFLVNKAHEKELKYCLLSADSIHFQEVYNFNPIINFLESDSLIGIVGFDLKGSKCPWEFLMNVTPAGIKFDVSNNSKSFNNIQFKHVDICRNIFLAKTETLLNLWDEEMKLAEHELAFLNYKSRGFSVYWTNTIQFKKINTVTSEEYQTYRKRFGDYQKLLKEKLGISGWVIYSPAAMKEIKEYKAKQKD